MKALLFVLLIALATACTPMEVVYWYGLHALPMPPDPVALSTQLEAPTGWVNLGHGIWGPSILTSIRQCESGGSYTIKNSNSSARGAYQFLTSSWEGYGHAARYNAPVASDAYPWQQDEAAVITFQASGTLPWLPSASCWQG